MKNVLKLIDKCQFTFSHSDSFERESVDWSRAFDRCIEIDPQAANPSLRDLVPHHRMRGLYHRDQKPFESGNKVGVTLNPPE